VVLVVLGQVAAVQAQLALAAVRLYALAVLA
jgi:hypothetical protein